MTEEEGGIRPQRVEFVRESTIGEMEADPAWNVYSDNMQTLDWSPTPGTEPRRGLGDIDISEVFTGPEAHEVTVSYDLQQALLSGGSPLDAAADAIERNSDNSLANTHQMVAREDINQIPASEAWGSTIRDTRLYLVMLGGFIGTATLTGDPGSDQPVVVELSYTAEKVREYQIDQPTSSEEPVGITFESSDAGDTSQTVTIQGTDTSDANQEEDVSLNGTTVVATSNDYKTIDAVQLDASTAGDVTVSINDGTSTSPTAGETLTVLRGSDYFGWAGDAGEGNLGIPALGSGSRASALASSYEQILDDTLERPSGTDVAFELNSLEFTCENNLDTRERIGTPRMGISAGGRDVTISATVLGPTESMQSAEQALASRENNLIWTLTNSTIQLDDAVLTDFGGISKEVGQAAMSLDNTFTGQGVTVA